MESRIEYKEKILIFFDVLGFKKMVEEKYRHDPKVIKEILSGLHLLSIPKYTSDVIVFSDSVINILEVKPELIEYGQTFSDYFMEIIRNLSRIQLQMIFSYGVLIRGAIVVGDIYYELENNIIFGPALINAHILESKHSIYPRFILDDSVVDKFENLESMDISKGKDDNFYYVDVLKSNVKTEYEKQMLKKLRDKLNKDLDSLGDNVCEKVLKKYEWFINEINEREKQNLKLKRN